MSPVLQDVITQVITPLGFTLFGLRQRGTKSRPLLEVRIARLDGQRIAVEDCATVSRAIEARLDADKTLGDFYTLEVSSPGIQDDAEINWKR
jgi:ribosome maturation factor RimP